MIIFKREKNQIDERGLFHCFTQAAFYESGIFVSLKGIVSILEKTKSSNLDNVNNSQFRNVFPYLKAKLDLNITTCS